MKALILVDLQNDFCKNGALEVKDAEAVFPLANALAAKFEVVVATQDWHPATHGSFAANHHLWNRPGQVIDLYGLPQVLWPIHCVQDTLGARFHKDLDTAHITKVVQKGTDETVDSYSGFFDNGRRKQTEMDNFLKSKGVDEVYILGVATDYCVKFTALDAVSLGYKTHLVVDACRGVNLAEDDVEKAIAEMTAEGVSIVQSADVLESI